MMRESKMLCLKARRLMKTPLSVGKVSLLQQRSWPNSIVMD